MKCTDGEKKSQLKHYYDRKALYIEKLGGKCIKCESTDDLEFDHIDPESKTFDIGSIMRRDIEVVLKELSKCQLLCTECHFQKTVSEGSLGSSWVNKPRLVHGSTWTYKHHGCRCIVCVKSHRERYPLKREYRDTGPIQHGQRRVYLKGCRCDLCRKSNADYAQKLRISKNARVM